MALLAEYICNGEYSGHLIVKLASTDNYIPALLLSSENISCNIITSGFVDTL